MTGIKPDHPVLLYFCGNAGSVSDRIDLLTQAAACDLGVVAVNYRGTGESDGTPTEEGVYQDALAVYDLVTGSKGIDPSNIVVWGHSIGGAVACELALRRPCAGLILESTFLSARAMAGRMLPFVPVGPFMSYRFDNKTAVAKLDLPKLFLHGTLDPMVPTSDSETLLRLAIGPKELWLIEGADHNDLHEVAGSAFFERICGFARRVTSNSPQPDSANP
jgi:hypothetical protein